MDSKTRAELEKVALGDADSGRGQLAKVTALRTLTKLDADAGVSWPVDDDGRFNPMPREWWPLDACESDEQREAWRLRWLVSREGKAWQQRPRVG
jgi:hypothetical protein